MSRTARQSKILELIASKNIETQEELVAELLKYNFAATQATISRDIKELGLIKVNDDKNKYKYAVVCNNDFKISQKLINIFRESIVTLTEAGNILVVKTMQGCAKVVAAVIEQLNSPEVAGIVSDGDVIVIVTKNPNDVESIKLKLNSMM